MIAGPGDEITPGAGRHLRASHADREQVIDMLKAAFVQGRLTRDEFGLQVGRALASQTYADLAALTADIPAGLTGVQPQSPPGNRLISKQSRRWHASAPRGRAYGSRW